ncbi:MAG: DUF2769 domain-containing protein [Dehalococcoidales bacterium]|nr:DUF2769 domain-containing protein [Dehalococcoidales bacterium]
MADIPFTEEKVNQCICPSCPVESQSQCSAELLKGPRHNPLKHEEVPGLYCAAGKAACPDLDFKKECICIACPVYMQYKLSGGKPPLYFCRDGASA